MSEMSEFQRTRKLEQEFYLLHLTYHRSHNQHRVAVWWRHFNMLHRWVRKLLDKLLSLETCIKSAEKIRLRKEAQAIARFLVRGRIFHNAYYAFNNVIALGQFIQLGMGLLAMTSSIHSSVMFIYDGSEIASQVQAPKAAEVVNMDDDIGEEIVLEAPKAPKWADKWAMNERDAGGREGVRNESDRVKGDLSDANSKGKSKYGLERKDKKEKKVKKEKKEKKSKKKARNAIDDIFG